MFSEESGFRIYIGNFQHAGKLPNLEKEGIKYVLNMSGGDYSISQEVYGNTCIVKIIYADDMEAYDLSQHFTEVCEFIEQARVAKTGVLVHCMAGVSRSVTATVAYLMRW